MARFIRNQIVFCLAVLLTITASMLFVSPAQAVPGSKVEYVVRPGDTLSSIAVRFEISLADLLAVNSQIKDPNIISNGQVIYLPAGRGEGLLKIKPRPIYFWDVEKDGGRVEKSDHLYRIASGDNFYKIAWRYGLTFDDLVAANPQTSAYSLRKGELIHIPIEKLHEGVYSFYETPPRPADESQ